MVLGLGMDTVRGETLSLLPPGIFHVCAILGMLIIGGLVMGIEIDKRVAIPASKPKYPYDDMEVGDSFFVEGGNIQTIANMNWRKGRRLSMKFISRRVDDGVRVWRTA